MPTPTKTEQTLKKGIKLLETQLSRDDLSVQARVEITKSLADLTGQLARFYERRKAPRRPVGRPSTNKKSQPLDPIHDPESPWYLPPDFVPIPGLLGTPGFDPTKAKQKPDPAPEQPDPGSPEGTDSVGGILGTPKEVAQEPQLIRKADEPQPEPPAPEPAPRNAPTFLVDLGAPVDLWRADTVISKAPDDQALYITNFQQAFAPGWLGEGGRRRLEEGALHTPENSYESRLLALFRWTWTHYRDRYYEIKLPGEAAFTAKKRAVDPRELRRNELLAATVPMAGELYETAAPRGAASSGFMPDYGTPATEPGSQKKEPFDAWNDNNPKPEEPEF